MDQNNLVILKDETNSFKMGETQFNRHKFYRCIEDGVDGYTVYGEHFTTDEFNLHFEFAYDKIMRDFQSIGLVNPMTLKPVSKKTFKELANIHTFTGGKGLYRAYFYNDVHVALYSFESSFRENKKTFIDCVYSHFINLCDGEMSAVDNKLIQFGNAGIPLSFSNLRIVDRITEKEFSLD